MSRPKPAIYGSGRTILLEVYENPGKRYDTFYFTDKLYFPNMANPATTRTTPEYVAKFKETVEVIESLVEQGLIDGKQLQHSSIGMYYTELKVRFKGKQAAIREKRQAEELERQMPEFLKRAQEVDEEMRKAEEKKQAQ